MSSHDLFILMLLASRLPIYLYVIHKAYVCRNALVLVSSNWLGLMALMGMMGAVSNAAGSRILTNILGTLFALALFMVAYTAKRLVTK